MFQLHLLNHICLDAQVGKYYHYLGTSDVIPPSLVPIALPIAQQQKQKESQFNGYLKPLKLSKPIPLKAEVVPQITIEIPAAFNQNSFQEQNQVKPLSYKLKKNKLRILSQPTTLEKQSQSAKVEFHNPKSFQDIKSPNSLSLFEPTSPLDNYKTKLCKLFFEF